MEPYWDRGRLLVAPFSAVIQDMGRVIKRVNAHFETDFVPFDHTEENVAAVCSEQSYHAGPNDHRSRLKKETRAEFDNALRADASLRRRMEEAEGLFALYMEQADAA